MNSNEYTDFHGVILKGVLRLDDRDAFQSLVHSLNGKRIKISLAEEFDADNLAHLRGWFHSSILPTIATASGYSHSKADLAWVKKGLKEHFLTVPTAPGEPVKVRSTESLTKKEYAEFIAHCRQYAAEVLSTDTEDPR